MLILGRKQGTYLHYIDSKNDERFILELNDEIFTTLYFDIKCYLNLLKLLSDRLPNGFCVK